MKDAQVAAQAIRMTAQEKINDIMLEIRGKNFELKSEMEQIRNETQRAINAKREDRIGEEDGGRRRSFSESSTGSVYREPLSTRPTEEPSLHDSLGRYARVRVAPSSDSSAHHSRGDSV
jgi:hypothetical protein